MTEEQNETSRWLDRARNADNVIKALEAVHCKDKSIAERCTVLYDSSGGSSGSGDNSVERAVHQLCDDSLKIRIRIDELRNIRSEIASVIESVSDPDLRTILHMRYLGYMKMYEIAGELNYDRRTIQRKHIEALDAVRGRIEKLDKDNLRKYFENIENKSCH